MKKSLRLMGVVFLGLLALGLSGSAKSSDYVAKSALEIKYTQKQVKEYLNNKYRDYVEKSYYIDFVPTLNLSQEILNGIYTSDPNFEGTCAEVASTIALNFYAGNLPNYPGNNEMFCECVDYATEKGWFVSGQGTKAYYCQSIFSDQLSKLGVEHTTWLNKDKFFQGVYDFTKAGKVQLFGVNEHDMVAIGYIEVKFQYTKTVGALWWQHDETADGTEHFIVCCSGWVEGIATPKSADKFIDDAYDFWPLDYGQNYLVGVDIPSQN